MKGVVLAGGLGTRLYPLTYATNKHLLPVFNKPMVYYPIKTLVDAGIDEILIVVGGPHAGHFMRVLKNGEDLGVKHLEYAYQENEGGIAHALSLAEDFSDGENICVILGDNCTDANITKDVDNFKDGGFVYLIKVPDPERFGVPTLDKKGNITKITEKPKKPDTNYAVTSPYMYDSEVFKIIKRLRPSDRGEMEITDVNNTYLKKGKLKWGELDGFWRDAGTFETLFEVNKYWSDVSIKKK